MRLQTWFPFTIQVYANGHEALARKMTQHGIAFTREDNCFTWIGNMRRAQRLADNFVRRRNWPDLLSRLGRRVNPLMRDLLKTMDYYWVMDQAEYSTDVLFRDCAALRPLYERLLRHAALCFSAEDVMTFLGKKGLHPAFEGEAVTTYKKRWPGARIKHRIVDNWIKMYDKHGCVLRIETVINNPRAFKIWRAGHRKGRVVHDWFPMSKSVANFWRYADVSRAANRRYLEALSVVDDPGAAVRQVRRVAEPARHKGRSYRGFNPAAESDARLFSIVMRGEHLLQGFRNADVRRHWFKAAKTTTEERSQSAAVSRLLKRLHMHGLIAKIPRTRRWRVSDKGQKLMSALMKLHLVQYPDMIMKEAA